MVNKNKWINSYMELNPESQIQVAEAIVKELKDNESALDEDDKRKQEIICEFFNRLIARAKDKSKLKKITTVLEKFENLSQDNQRKVIGTIHQIISKSLNQQNKEQAERTCVEEGHMFSSWEERRWTTKEVYWDQGPQGYVDVEHKRWYRSCERCGFEELTEHEPQELIQAREEKKRQEKIKSLKKELELLENTNKK